MGGKEEDIALARPFVEQFARKIETVGPLGSGMAVKSINNCLNSAHLLTITEGLIALKKLGIEYISCWNCNNRPLE